MITIINRSQAPLKFYFSHSDDVIVMPQIQKKTRVFLTILTLAWAAPNYAANSAPSPQAQVPEPETSCTYAKEYITALEYFRAQKEFALSEAEAQKLSKKIALNCTGAAQRFIKVTTLLSHAGLSTPNAIQNGLDFISRTDAEVQTFMTVFMKTFTPDYLDLDMNTSMNMARSLVFDFKGDSLQLRKDFERLLDFCLSEKDLNLPRPQCGNFAARISLKGDKFDAGVSTPFLKLFDFLRSEAGPDLTTGQALELTEKLIAGGKHSLDNFTQAFKYGISKKGLNIPIRDAIQFARDLTIPPKS